MYKACLIPAPDRRGTRGSGCLTIATSRSQLLHAVLSSPSPPPFLGNTKRGHSNPQLLHAMTTINTLGKENSELDLTNLVWLPAIPNNPPFDVQKRIEELRSYMDPNNRFYQPERQHVNIEAIIRLYENKEINGTKPVHVMDGKIISWEQMFKGPLCSWTEGTLHQLPQRHAYGQGPFGLGFHEVS